MSKAIDLSTQAVQRRDIQLVFFDVDGTLLSTQGTYSENLKTQIRRLHKRGIKTAIASGRPSYAARFLIDELNIHHMGVFCTGAEIYDPSEQHHEQLHTLDHVLVSELYQRAKASGVYCELYTPLFHSVDSVCHISQIHARHLHVQPKIIDGATLIYQSLPIIKLLLGSNTENNPLALQYLEEAFPEVEFAYARFPARPTWEFASVINAKASKKAAFDYVLQHYDILPENVMAIGDSQSDITFVQLAGAGVAMANGSDDLKAVADYITLHTDDDGAAFALQTLIE